MKNSSLWKYTFISFIPVFFSCNKDENGGNPDDPDAPRKERPITLTQDNLEKIGAYFLLSVTAQKPVDYDEDGNASTDILSQMKPCEKDDLILFTDSKKQEYAYDFDKKCQGQILQLVINKKYVIDENDIFLLDFPNQNPDKAARTIILENAKLYSFRKPNKLGRDSYRMEYDRKDEKTGEMLHWHLESTK